MKKGKALLQSKTFWFNLLAIIVAIASFFGFGEFNPDPKVSEGIATATAIINILLRMKTNQPINKLM